MVEIVEADAERRVAVMRAAGAADKGQGAAKALIPSCLRAVGGPTEIRIATELEVTGRVAQIGRSGLMQDVSTRLVAEFARCVELKLRASAAELLPQGSGRLTDAPDVESSQQPVKPVLLLLSVLLGRLKRIISRGAIQVTRRARRLTVTRLGLPALGC